MALGEFEWDRFRKAIRTAPPEALLREYRLLLGRTTNTPATHAQREALETEMIRRMKGED